MLYTEIKYYQITRPNLFNGSSDNGTDCENTGNHLLRCSDEFMNTRRLVDGDTGPLHSLSLTNLHRFLAWNRTQTKPVTLKFEFNPLLSSSSLSSVVLYFFNYPTQRISLPSVTLRGSFDDKGTSIFPISYIYGSNGDLRNNDSQLRNVTLSITSNIVLIQMLFVDLSFPNNNDIDWILLSEVDICQGIYNIIHFSCSKDLL